MEERKGVVIGSRTRVIAAAFLTAAAAAVWSGPAAGQVLRVGTTTAKAPSGKLLRLRTPSGVRAGDVLLAAVTVRAGSARGIVAPRGWRRVRSTAGRGTGVALAQAVFLRVATGSEPRFRTWTLRRAHGGAGAMLAYRGVHASSPVLGSSSRLGRRTASVTAPSFSAPAGALLVGFFGASGTGRTASPLGMRELYDVTTLRGWRVMEAAAHRVQATAGPSGSPTARFGRRRGVAIGQLVALRPADVAPPWVPTGLPALLAPSTGTTFYVATTGSDSNPGTLAAPWRTIQKAFNTLAPGQRALVRGGMYSQDLEFDRAGTASAPITIEAYPGEQPIVNAVATHPLRVNGDAAYFRFSGFVIQNHPGTSGGNVDIYGSHIEISRNEIRFSTDQGIYTDEEADHVHILGNWIHHNGEGITHQSHGMYLQGTDHFVANNVIHDQPEGFGIQVYDYNRRSIIVSNTITTSGHAGIVVGGSLGVSDIVLRNNVLAFNDQWGVQMDSDCPTSNVDIDHNVIFGNAYGVIEAGCGAIDTSGGNVLADPLFVDYGGRNLRLNAGSPAIDSALPDWSLTTDHVGASRAPSPDIGAYER